ncbi:phage tail tape measure protein [Paenibacillus contaminans]|uniref:Phage tail tape measure protein n=1 Tax=Paenibacillus contaminans TaxID=450362 RepID=A0A329LY51_9BACL|nr:phage tail tape measure protein [Paenibacillus contaminans]RAV12172.1 phage tail tape measure protein [Paenibacillus contaminans]
MADNLKLTVTAILNTSSAAVEALNNQIRQLSDKTSRIAIKVSIDPPDAAKQATPFQTLAATISSTFKEKLNIKQRISDFFVEGIKYVNELNKTLTEISVITGKSQQEVSSLGQEYGKLARELGVTTKYAADASIEFYRQGLSQEEVLERVKTSTAFAKASNLDYKKSADMLTATVQSMGVSIERAADVFSYLGGVTTAKSDEIGKGLQKAGGSAKALGIDFEKISTWIALVSSRSRESAESVGQSFQTILSRMQGLKDNKSFSESDSVQVDEMADALSRVGIQLLDNEGQFRNFGTVMDELGMKWSTLGAYNKQYLSALIGGASEQKRFLQLMEGYKDTIPLYEQALFSAGTTQQKFALHQEGTEAALNRLRASLEGLWQNAFQTDTLQSAINLLTGLVSAVDSVVETLGFLPTMAGTATAAFFLFNKTALKGFYDELGLLPTRIGLFKLQLQEVMASGNLAATAMRGLTVALGGLVRAILPLAIVTGITYGVTKLFEAFSSAKERAKEATTVNYEHVNSLKEQKKALEEAASEYQALKQTEESGSATLEQKQKLYQLQEQLVSQYGVSVTGINNEGKAYTDSAELINARVKSLEDQIAKENELNLVKLRAKDSQDTKAISKASNKRDTAEEELKDYEEQLKRFEEDVRKGRVTNKDGFYKKLPFQLDIDPAKSPDAIRNLREGLNFKVAELQKEFEEANNTLQERLKERIAGLQGASDQYIRELQSSGTKISAQQKAFINEMIKSVAGDKKDVDVQLGEIKQAIDALNAADFNKLLDDFQAAKASGNESKMEDIREQILKLTDTVSAGIPKAEAFKAKISEWFTVTKQAKAETFDFDGSVAKLHTTIGQTSKSIEPLNKLLQDMADGKQINADTISGLVEKEKGLIDAVTIENGVISINQEAVENLRNAKLQAIEDPLKKLEGSLEAQRVALNTELQMYGLQIAGIESVAKAKNELLARDNEIDAQLKKQGSTDFKNTGSLITGVARPDFTPGSLLELEKEQIQKKLYELDKFKYMQDDLKRLQIEAAALSPNKEKSAGGGSKSGSETREQLKDALELQDTLKERINAINSEHEARRKNIEAIERQIKLHEKQKDYKLAIEETNRLLNEQQAVVEGLVNANKALHQEADDIRSKNAKYGDEAFFDSWFDANNEASEAYKQFLNSFAEQSRLVHDSSAMTTEAKNKEIDRLQNEQKEVQKLFDQLSLLKHAYGDNITKIVEMNDAIDASNENNEKYRQEIKQTIDELGKQATEKHDKWVDETEAALKQTVEAYKEAFRAIGKEEDKRHEKTIANLEKDYKQYERAIGDIIGAYDRLNEKTDYEEELTAKEQDMAELVKRQTLLLQDDSLEGKALARENQQTIDDLDRELAKMKRDRSRETTKQGLEDALETERRKTERLKEEENERHQAIKARLDAVIEDEKIFAQLEEAVFSGHTTNLKLIFDGLGDSLKSMIADVGKGLDAELIQPLNQIGTDLGNKTSAGKTKLEQAAKDAQSGKTEAIGGSVKGEEWLAALSPNDRAQAIAAMSGGKLQDWEVKLLRATYDDEYAKYLIQDAKEKWQQYTDNNDTAKADAAHQWAERVRAVNPKIGSELPAYGDYPATAQAASAFSYVPDTGRSVMNSVLNSFDVFGGLSAGSMIGSGIVQRSETKNESKTVMIDTMFNVEKMDASMNPNAFFDKFINGMKGLGVTFA